MSQVDKQPTTRSATFHGIASEGQVSWRRDSGREIKSFTKEGKEGLDFERTLIEWEPLKAAREGFTWPSHHVGRFNWQRNIGRIARKKLKLRRQIRKDFFFPFVHLFT